MIDEFLHNASQYVPALKWGMAWFAICALICIPLTFFFPVTKSQKLIRPGLFADIIYWFLNVGAYGTVAFFISYYAIMLLHDPLKAWYAHSNWLRQLPLFVQFFLVLLAADMLQYWIHRALHGNILWGFHAIHHSSRDLDWLSSARLHPVNFILYSSLAGSIVPLIGFNPGVYPLWAMFITVYSPLNHSNLNWTFGPFRYVIGSPIYHRWHHTIEGNNKNLAFYFPFIDMVFGTFYMPRDRLPENLGTPEPMPHGFLGQLVHPFRAPVAYVVARGTGKKSSV